MRTSRDHILTSHAGSLPRPDDLIEANRAREAGETSDERAYQEQLRSAVEAVVRRQRQVGIDLPGDGEFGKSMGHKVNYRAWWSYSFHRLGGLDLGAPGVYYEATPKRSRPGEVVLTSFADRRDRNKFLAVYTDPDSGASTGPRAASWPVCVGKVFYKGQDAIQADIAHFKAALKACGVEEGFMTSVAPGSAARLANKYYKTDEEFIFACAEAMREEYKAIIDAGLILQIDDPSIAENWDMINPEPSVEDYKKFSMIRIEAINHAIKGLPQDRVRFHLCWGSWHGPHTTDIPMRDIVDVMLAIKCQAYSFEAGNVRHEHEWTVWQDVKLPDGKIILPGVVSHATNVVEHPELVAQRILRFTESVGRERVIASSDCGLGGRVHPLIAWAKLEALAQGAALASRALWR
ncbi:MAG TPA: cobalamin-independent methionine synthase II family protein [Xanthobacteraceae bacterium]|nr:cobalamin-independent methionine synthase II family protein [Xanthobacteraceae bacterium]